MAKSKVHITSSRMLSLLETMVSDGKARNQGDALEQIGMHPANLRKIKNGANKFTVEQIEAACRITGASADYVFGYSIQMMRKEPRSPVDMLKAALQILEGRKLRNASIDSSILL